MSAIELPESLYRRVEEKARERGIPVQELVSEIVEEKFREETPPAGKPWMKSFGALRDLHDETERIMRITEEEHEQIEPEMWT